MNDIYYYSALLYTIWTGKCFRKDEVEDSLAQFAGELKLAGVAGDNLARLVSLNLKDDAVFDKESTIPELLKEIERIGGKIE